MTLLKKISLLVLPLLVGCIPSQGTYDPLLYHTQDFSANFYEDVFFDAMNTQLQTTETYQGLTYDTNQPLSNDPNGDSFAMQYRLSNRFSSLKYGYESKLFDGILYCTDAQRLSKSRLQLLPTGTGFHFPRPLKEIQNLVLFMKAGADTNAGAEKIQDFIVHLSFYRPVENGYVRHTFDVTIENLVPSNFPGYYSIDLPNEIVQDSVAFGFTYTILDPIPLEPMQDKTGIFLYEVLFPNARWA